MKLFTLKTFIIYFTISSWLIATSSIFFFVFGNQGGSIIGTKLWPIGGDGKINSIQGGVTYKLNNDYL